MMIKNLFASEGEIIIVHYLLVTIEIERSNNYFNYSQRRI